MDNGASLMLDFEVKKIDKSDGGYKISSADINIEARYVVNCGGVYADDIYKLVDPSTSMEIQPIRGQYYLLDKNCGSFVNHVVFPCPSKLGKGTLIVPTVDGNLLVGPDSELLATNQKEAVDTEKERLDYVRTLASKLIKDIPYRETVTTFSGLRADPKSGDFILEESSCGGFFNAAGIKSPGLSCAPAIGQYMAELVAIKGNFETNPLFNPIRRENIKMANMTDDEKNILIQKDSRYGRIICRCEMITEGEIVDVIHRNAGGRTLNGIKRRARPGAGRCQGGFCSPRVLEILAREMKSDMREICLESKDSKVLMGLTKSADKEVV
jgi:glycerol-3-phosphate dehydrogenase